MIAARHFEPLFFETGARAGYKIETPFDQGFRESTTASQRDRPRPQSYGPLNRLSLRDPEGNMTGDFQPMVVYVPTETLEENRPLPLVIFPYCNRQHSTTASMHTSPRYVRPFEHTVESMYDMQNSTHFPSTKEHALMYSHPRVTSPYSPTINLDRRSSYIEGKVWNRVQTRKAK